MPADLHALRSRFARSGLTIGANDAGLVYLDAVTRAATARLYLQGAHLTHYQPAGAAPFLFTSARSLFQPGKPVRGGVPIVFPWFGPHPTDPAQPAHGWARTSDWELVDVAFDGDAFATVSLTLSVVPFALQYKVRAGPALDMSIAVHNTGAAPATFEEALHTYLAVGDVRRVRMEGLAGRDYLDKVDGAKCKTQSGPITITGETDRVYLDTSDRITVHDPVLSRQIVVEKEGSLTTVVWNPWIEKARRLPDFGDDEWPDMLCIETANAAKNRVTLRPNERHTMRATVRVD